MACATAYANLTITVLTLAGAMVLHEPLMAVGIVCRVLILVGIYGGRNRVD
jgi:multidrug transporter EmrE-like cation transporter